ncbi:hypothetical protein CL634_08355 [bacterium]|nr:hypothetical protein [bacterium]|tara:strand:+ start:302 stop:568 length:267 start_codon:yes stop_codon:yes gene_type:complete
MSHWRYACVKRTYHTILPDEAIQEEVVYELVEFFDEHGYTMEPVIVTSDKSKEDLAKWLRLAADDVEKHDLIIDKEPVVHVLQKEPKS